MTKTKLLITFILFIILIAALWLYAAHRSKVSLQQMQAHTSTSTTIISDDQLRTYLLASNFAQPFNSGTTFVAFQRLSEVASSSSLTKEYLWFMTQEYYKKDGALQKGRGVSLPIAIYFDQKQPVALNVPREGSLYNSDFEKIFPGDIRATSTIADAVAHEELISRLEADIRIQAEKHFGMSLGGTPRIENAATSTEAATSTQELVQ